VSNVEVDTLMDEILAQAQAVALQSFQDRMFTVHDMTDALARIENQGFPVALIAYEGMEPVGGNDGLTSAGRATAAPRDTLLVNVRFSVIVAVEYGWNNEQDDQKRDALRLLSVVRRQLHGYVGVNSRPWRFVTEGPMPVEDMDGVIFYAQMWETTTVEQATRT